MALIAWSGVRELGIETKTEVVTKFVDANGIHHFEARAVDYSIDGARIEVRVKDVHPWRRAYVMRRT